MATDVATATERPRKPSLVLRSIDRAPAGLATRPPDDLPMTATEHAAAICSQARPASQLEAVHAIAWQATLRKRDGIGQRHILPAWVAQDDVADPFDPRGLGSYLWQPRDEPAVNGGNPRLA